MAEPTVCSFLTKVLCANGGRMFLQDLRTHVELSEARLRDVLRQAGPDRFLLQEVEMKEGLWDAEAEVAAGAGGGGGGGPSAWRVVAVSAARLCARYQRGECQACDQLHFCRRHMQGKCPNRDCWSTCTLSHDIHTPVNIQVLKNHGLFGLNEAQLRILLLQNDPCLLPEVCLCYNKGEALYGYCNLKDKCNKFHVCKSFVRGECRLQKCKRSHQLIHATHLKLLQDQGLSIPSVVNFQIIATYRHEKLHKMLENKDNSASSAEHSQGLEKQGGPISGATEARPLVCGPAPLTKKPGTGQNLILLVPQTCSLSDVHLPGMPRPAAQEKRQCITHSSQEEGVRHTTQSHKSEHQECRGSDGSKSRIPEALDTSSRSLGTPYEEAQTSLL